MFIHCYFTLTKASFKLTQRIPNVLTGCPAVNLLRGTELQNSLCLCGLPQCHFYRAWCYSRPMGCELNISATPKHFQMQCLHGHSISKNIYIVNVKTLQLRGGGGCDRACHRLGNALHYTRETAQLSVSVEGSQSETVAATLTFNMRRKKT